MMRLARNWLLCSGIERYTVSLLGQHPLVLGCLPYGIISRALAEYPQDTGDFMSASFVFNADLRQLKQIRRSIIDAASSFGARREIIDDIVYAANELIANAITYGYGGNTGPIWVEVWREADVLYVRIRDAAPAFNPLNVPLPYNLLRSGQRRAGGLGLFLSRHLLDDLQYQALPQGGNELILVKWNAF